MVTKNNRDNHNNNNDENVKQTTYTQELVSSKNNISFRVICNLGDNN